MSVQTMVKCSRCEGTGVYQDKGACFRCQGTGVEPPAQVFTQNANRTNNTNRSVSALAITNKSEVNVTNNMIKSVMVAMVEIIESKGARNKMCMVYDIDEHFRKYQNIHTTNLIISAILDVLIAQKMVRFFRNDKDYYYFGITEFGWYKWDTRITLGQRTVNTETGEITEDNNIPPENPVDLEGLLPLEPNDVIPTTRNNEKQRVQNIVQRGMQRAAK